MMLAEVVTNRPSVATAEAERPLLRTTTTTTTTTVPFCRTNCYKLLIGIVLVFVLMQFAANFVAYRHKYSFGAGSGTAGAQSQSMANHWLIATAVATPAVAANHHHIHNRLVAPTVVVANDNGMAADDNALNKTLTAMASNSGATNTTASASQTADPILNYLLNETSFAKNTSSLDSCPLIPPKLVGRLKVLTDSPSLDALEELFPELEPGGRYHPPDCLARSKVAVIIPYRDREEHLRTFLHNIHPMLVRQQLDYGIYIVEEATNGKFNRAKLFNVGFLEALKQYDYQCFVFHDVDLIPEDDRNLYTCPEQPRHMSVGIDKFSYRLPYQDLFGGVSALTTEQFKRINGFSNEFWGWGGEDDDMSNRVRYYGYKISRYSANIARYKMLSHKKDTPNPDRYKKLYSGKRRYKTDGINNIEYKVVDLVFKKLFTWILVDLMP